MFGLEPCEWSTYTGSPLHKGTYGNDKMCHQMCLNGRSENPFLLQGGKGTIHITCARKICDLWQQGQNMSRTGERGLTTFLNKQTTWDHVIPQLTCA